MSFDNVYDIIVGLTPGGLEWLAFLVAGGILAFAVINAVVMSGAIYTWFERRALGRFQSRLGPNRWGPFGLFQPFADILKLLSKEDVVPDPADRTVFHIARSSSPYPCCWYSQSYRSARTASWGG